MIFICFHIPSFPECFFSCTEHFSNIKQPKTKSLNQKCQLTQHFSLPTDPCLVHYCPKGMECIIAPSNVPKCICQRKCVIYNKRKRRHVCGSDGIIYDNFCELFRAACHAETELKISSMDTCSQHQQQQQKPHCTPDEYALMKDNLLLFHHQNMVYLQHGDDDHMVHRMEYLVSIIFSHYDQNNDGLVERDELQFMWNTMDMHHVANESNCTLMDMLIYDDGNDDNVLTINEFNDAFHRISETVQRQTQQVRISVKMRFKLLMTIFLKLAILANALFVSFFAFFLEVFKNALYVSLLFDFFP